VGEIVVSSSDHASATTTLTHYVHANPEDAARLGTVTSGIFDEILTASDLTMSFLDALGYLTETP
jgi:hypothetical protein